MTAENKKSSPDVLKTVKLLRDLELMPLPISRKSKLTYCKNFTDPAFISPYKDWETSDIGVGLVLSERYKLVDIDIDDPRIENLSVAHLPQGGWIFGRKSKKRSHHVFVIADSPDSADSLRAMDPKGKGYMDTEQVLGIADPPDPRPTIIEFRGHGAQTVMPGTLHEKTGELIQWDGGNQPTELPAAVDSVELRRAVRKIGFTVMVGDHAWKAGIRHQVSLSLAGMMAMAKWDQAEAEHWFNCLMDWTGEGEKRNVMSTVRDTFKKAAKKERIQGGPALSDVTGCPQLVSAFRHLFMDSREAAFDDMNSRYAVGVYFSKVQIFDFTVIDDVSKPDFETMSVSDFELLTSNQKIWVPGKRGKIQITKAKHWLEHSDRRTYRITDFMPGKDPEVNGALNLWRRWGADENASGSIDAWMHHVDEYICRGDQEMKDWLMSWLADIIQNPMDKPGTAVMMRSGTRSGKNTFIEMMKKVIGIRYVREMNSSGQITNRFNSHFQHALLVMANEADFSTSDAATNVLKTLITDKDFHMDHKHGHAKTGRNYTRVVLASNKIHVINRDFDDERYTVIDVQHPGHVLSVDDRVKHFNRIYAEINGDGPGKLLHYLKNYRYDRDRLRTCYQSEAGRAQTLMSMNPVAQWWARCISDGRIRVPDEYSVDRVKYVGNEVGWPEHIGKAAIEAAFRDQHTEHKRIASPAFHAMLYQCSGLSPDDSHHFGNRHGRYRGLRLPELEKARAMMNEIYPGAVESDDPITDDLLNTPIERDETEEEF